MKIKMRLCPSTSMIFFLDWTMKSGKISCKVTQLSSIMHLSLAMSIIWFRSTDQESHASLKRKLLHTQFLISWVAQKSRYSVIEYQYCKLSNNSKARIKMSSFLSSFHPLKSRVRRLRDCFLFRFHLYLEILCLQTLYENTLEFE